MSSYTNKCIYNILYNIKETNKRNDKQNTLRLPTIKYYYNIYISILSQTRLKKKKNNELPYNLHGIPLQITRHHVESPRIPHIHMKDGQF